MTLKSADTLHLEYLVHRQLVSLAIPRHPQTAILHPSRAIHPEAPPEDVLTL
jgi:hypothetical protein